MSKNISMVVFVGIIAVISSALKVVMGALAVVFGVIVAAKVPLMIFAAPIIYLIYQYFYFEGKAFKELKESISQYTKNCNELNHHILELKAAYAGIKSFDYGKGSMNDDSKLNFKRPQWSIGEKNRFVHNCSAVVCKNAHN